MPEVLPDLYSSQAEMIRLMTEDAFDARMEDISTDTAEKALVVQDCILDATDDVNMYCEKWYDPADMARNYWVRRQATWLACYYLFQRGADPGYFHDRFVKIHEVLERIFSGRMQIPRLATRGDLTPAVSNFIMDDRFYARKLRVQHEISTGGTSGKQDLSSPNTYDVMGW